MTAAMLNISFRFKKWIAEHSYITPCVSEARWIYEQQGKNG